MDNAQKTEKQVEFGMYDNRGREIGARILVWHELDGFAPERPFRLRVHATRNGLTYGASQPMRAFRSAQLRDEAISKYLSGARRRASR